MKVFIWPDGTWCEDDNIAEYETWKSDDYSVMDIPDDVEDIDKYITETLK